MAVLERDAATANDDKNAGMVLQTPRENISYNKNKQTQDQTNHKN